MALTKVKGHIIADDLALGGNPTTSTQSTGNNTTRLATTAFVQTELSALVDSSPSALNTLNELAAAMGDDANFSTTVTNSIALKAPLASPTFTGDLTIPSKIRHAGDTDNYFSFADIDTQSFVTGNSTRLQITNSLVRFNQENNNQDFQVQSSSTDNMLYVDASTDRVGIGTASPNTRLTVGSGSGTEVLTILAGTSSESQLRFADGTSGTAAYQGRVEYDHANSLLNLGAGGGTQVSIGTNGLTSINASTGQSAGNLRVTGTSGHSYIGANRNTTGQGEVGYSLNTGGSTVWWNYLAANSNELRWYSNSGNRLTLTQGGVLTVSGGLNVTTGSATIGNGSATANLIINGSNTGESVLRFYDNGAESWMALHNNATNVLSFRRSSVNRLNLQADGTVQISNKLILGQDANNTGELYINDASGTAYTLGILSTSTRTYEIRGSSSGAAYQTSFTNPGGGGHNVNISGLTRVTSGNLTVTSGARICFDDNGDTFISEYSANELGVYTGGGQRMKFSGGNVYVVGGGILPSSDNAQDLGTASARWRNLYTGDLHLSNEGSQNDVDGTSGNWTIQEGEEHLFIINNNTGKKYKFALEEIA